MLDPRNGIAQRAIRVVQIRRPLQACEPFRGRRVVEIVRVKLAAQIAEPSLELRLIDYKSPRQSEKRKIITVPSERQDSAALRTEVLINGSAGTAVSALQCRDRLRRNRVGSHWAL